MIDYIKVIILLCLLKIRWQYFNLCPWYIKFTIGNQIYFQNMLSNTIHYQIIPIFNDDSPFARFNK